MFQQMHADLPTQYMLPMNKMPSHPLYHNLSAQQRSFMTSSLFLLVLSVNVNDLLHFLVTAEEDTRSVVDVLGHNGEHTLHLAVNSLTTS